MSDNAELTKRFKNQRGNAFSIVLNDDFEGLILRNTHYVYHSIMCGSLPLVFVACIKHEWDTADDGHVKTPHYHIVIVLSSSVRIGTMINELMCIFNGLQENQISIEKCNSVSSQVRYLVHLDDIDKYQYDFGDIESNKLDAVKGYMKEIHKIVDANDLIAIVREYRNLTELIKVIGLDNYKKYRVVIRDIREII